MMYLLKLDISKAWIIVIINRSEFLTWIRKTRMNIFLIFEVVNFIYFKVNNVVQLRFER